MLVSGLLNRCVWRCMRGEQQKRNDQVCDDRSDVWSGMVMSQVCDVANENE